MACSSRIFVNRRQPNDHNTAQDCYANAEKNPSERVLGALQPIAVLEDNGRT